MRIIFNIMDVGLGNNGGSHTLVKSANTLKKLGHDVYFLTNGSSRYTWTKIKAPQIRHTNIDNCCKDADFIIATGYKSVKSTLSAPKNCGIKLHWIRGWETWVYPEEQIFKKILNNNIIKLVNSTCLQRKLKEFNIESHIIRPGNDFNIYKVLNLRDEKNIVIGGLFNKKHFNSKRVQWIIQAFDYFKKKFKNVKCYLLGNDEFQYKTVDFYLKRPSEEEKNIFYNKIDIWLAPTNLEGLHIPPQEAMLTEACVVGTNAQMSGTQDYLVDNETGLVADENIGSFINKIEELIIDKDKRIALGKNGRKKIIELGDRENNMMKLINLLENIKNGNVC